MISTQFCVPRWSNEGWKRPATCWFILHVFVSLCLSLRDAVSLFCRLQIDCLMILRKHARISLFLVHCFSKSTPQYGPWGMLFLFSPGRCLKSMGRGWPLTPWRVVKLNIKQFSGMSSTQTSWIAGNKFSIMSLFPVYGCRKKGTT